MWDLIDALMPYLYFFWKWKFFHFPKKLQVLDQVHFKKIYNDWISQHLYFFCIFEKNYNDWIKSFSKSKWTGLSLIVHSVVLTLNHSVDIPRWNGGSRTSYFISTNLEICQFGTKISISIDVFKIHFS